MLFISSDSLTSPKNIKNIIRFFIESYGSTVGATNIRVRCIIEIGCQDANTNPVSINIVHITGYYSSKHGALLVQNDHKI